MDVQQEVEVGPKMRECSLMKNGMGCACKCACCEGTCDRTGIHLVDTMHNRAGVQCPRHPNPLEKHFLHDPTK